MDFSADGRDVYKRQIDVCVNTKNKDFGEAMIEAFGPDKADVIYDLSLIHI